MSDTNLKLIDLDQDYENAYHRLLERVPVDGGYLLHFDATGSSTALVHFDGEIFTELAVSPQEASYKYLITAGDQHFFSLTYRGGVREAYVFRTDELRLIRVADEFVYLENLNKLAVPFTGSGAPLLWWDETSIYTAAPPYVEVSSAIAISGGVGTVGRAYQRQEGHLILFSDLHTILTDGTQDGTREAEVVIDPGSFSIHEADDYTYLTGNSRLYAITSEGEITETIYPDNRRNLHAAYVVSDSLFLLVNKRISDTLSVYQFHGPSNTMSRVNVTRRLNMHRVKPFNLVMTDARFFSVSFERDSLVLYSYDRRFLDRQREIAVENNNRVDGGIGISGSTVGERTVLSISVRGTGGTFPPGLNSYVYDRNAPIRFRPLSTDPINFSKVLYEYPDGDSYLISLAEYQAGVREEHPYFYKFSTGELTALPTKLSAEERTPNENGTYVWAGEVLYYLEYTYGGIQVTLVDPLNPATATVYRDFGEEDRRNYYGLNSFLTFPNRLIKLGSEHGSEAIFTIYPNLAEINVAENVFGRTQNSADYSINVYDDVMLGTKFFDFSPGVAIRNGGADISYFNERNTVEFQFFVAATDTTLIYRNHRSPYTLYIYSKDMRLTGGVASFTDTEDTHYMSDMEYHKGRLYFTKRSPKFGSTQTYSLGYRTVQAPEEEVILHTETFTSTEGPLPLAYVVAGDDRVYFAWPSHRDRTSRTFGYSDGTVAGTVTHTDNSPLSDSFILTGKSIYPLAHGAFISDPSIERFAENPDTRRFWCPADQNMSYVIESRDFGVSRGMKARGAILGTDGYLLLLSAVEESRQFFLFIDRDGNYSTREILDENRSVGYMWPYGPDRFIISSRNALDMSSITTRCSLRTSKEVTPKYSPLSP